LDYPDATVWVFWTIKALMAPRILRVTGARYITRADNKDAKAGKPDNVLRSRWQPNARSSGLDADFCTPPDFLKAGRLL